MQTLRSGMLWVLTTNLLVSLGLTNIYPHLSTDSGRVSQVAKACCCGTKAGRCCGMNCCQLASPKSEKSPSNQGRLDHRGQPLDLVQHVPAHFDTPDLCHDNERGELSYELGETGSLFELRTRLNI